MNSSNISTFTTKQLPASEKATEKSARYGALSPSSQKRILLYLLNTLTISSILQINI